jgi:hypothetical protein
VSATERPTETPPSGAGDGGPPRPPRETGISRRQFLPRAAAGAAGLVAAGVVGYELHPSSSGTRPETTTTTTATTSTSSAAPAASASSEELQSFVTRPDLRPPAVKVTRYAGAASSPEYILLSANNVVQGGPVQQGLMIVDRQGRLVLFQPAADGKPFDFNAQTYQGRPVLTWWEGHLVSTHGAGVGYMADDRYRPLRHVTAGDGLQIDLHELNLTSRGTALVTAYSLTKADLRPLGGSARHPVYESHAQEIDLATGKVLLSWNSLDHVDIAESFERASRGGGPVDYLHINSVGETADGNLIVSGRNTSAVYKLDRTSGKVLWRLGGKRSDFRMPGAARFHWQHHVRAWDASTLTVFDNGANGTEPRSRALLLDLDESARRATLTRAYTHPAGFVAPTLGSVTRLSDGRVFVGWGGQPYFSEFAPDGTLLLDGQLPVGVRSYRAFTTEWSGRPERRPDIVARANPVGGFVIRVSWNGATGVDRWQILGGRAAGSLQPVGSQPWTGFETAIAVNSTGPSFQAIALDSHGRELGRSAVI